MFLKLLIVYGEILEFVAENYIVSHYSLTHSLIILFYHL